MDNLNLKSLKICAYPKVPLLDGLLGMNKSQNLMEIDEMLEDVHEVFSRLQKLSVGLTQVVDTSGRVLPNGPASITFKADQLNELFLGKFLDHSLIANRYPTDSCLIIIIIMNH